MNTSDTAIVINKVVHKHIYKTNYLGLICLALVLLKAFKVISISWWWVFAPIWAPTALFLGIMALLGILAVGCVILAAIFNR